MSAQQFNTTTSAKWDDIVFESRHKAYGAYNNRVNYSKNVVIAWFVTIIVAGMVIAYPTVKEWFAAADEEVVEIKKKVSYTDLSPPPPIDKNTPPPPKIDIPKVQKQIKFLPPKVTEKEVVEEEPMPTIEEIKQNDVGATDVEGDIDVEFAEPVVAVVQPEEDEDKVFTVVEQPAEFEGGLQAMYAFIRKNLKYPASARRMNIEGSVYVSFIIDKAGLISDVQIVKGISADCDKEAERVVKMMPNWKPGKQNGRAVKSKFVLPIKFKLQT